MKMMQTDFVRPFFLSWRGGRNVLARKRTWAATQPRVGAALRLDTAARDGQHGRRNATRVRDRAPPDAALQRRGRAEKAQTCELADSVALGAGLRPSTGPKFSPVDIFWIEGKYASFPDNRASGDLNGHFGLISLGADYAEPIVPDRHQSLRWPTCLMRTRCKIPRPHRPPADPPRSHYSGG